MLENLGLMDLILTVIRTRFSQIKVNSDNHTQPFFADDRLQFDLAFNLRMQIANIRSGQLTLKQVADTELV